MTAAQREPPSSQRSLRARLALPLLLLVLLPLLLSMALPFFLAAGARTLPLTIVLSATAVLSAGLGGGLFMLIGRFDRQRAEQDDRQAHFLEELRGEIARRTRAEERAAVEEERFRQLVELAPDAIMIVQEGRYSYLNPAALRLFGADDADQLLGTPAIERLHPDDRDAVRERMAAVRARGRVAPLFRERYLRIDGSQVDAEVLGAPIAFKGSDGILVFARDIGKRIQAEAEQASLQARLLQAQKLESIGRLAGGVAHDFNNHLSTMLGYCEMVRDRLPPADPCHEMLSVMAEAGERAAELTRQLLAFSRRQEMRMEPLDLNSLLTGLRRMLESSIGEHIELEIRTTVRLPPLLADPRQIQQVVLNLALNARDAMPAGGKIVIETSAAVLEAGDARLRGGMKPGSYLCLAVSDSGPGLTPEARERIWEPFSSALEPGSGISLGMATVFGIIKQHAAYAHVDSEPGLGTTVGICFPAIAAAVPAVPPAAVGGSETILVVDDEAVLRRLVVDSLRPLGYTVLDAQDGVTALRLLETCGRPVDLLITDVVMPAMNGPELARSFRRRYPRAGVIFITGYAAGAFGTAGEAAEKETILDKPLSPRKLAAAVRAALDGAHRNGAVLESQQ